MGSLKWLHYYHSEPQVSGTRLMTSFSLSPKLIHEMTLYDSIPLLHESASPNIEPYILCDCH